MNFPKKVSLTITNTCNLRCKMCGQWSEEGYIQNNKTVLKNEMDLDNWKKVIDELSDNKVKMVYIRGGEPFLFPGIIELLKYIKSKNIFMAIDSNGTFLEKYAEDLHAIGNMHITISIDGPEETHDFVRGIKGTFQKIKNGIAKLDELDDPVNPRISKSICFTASNNNYKTLGQLPDVARELGIKSINVMPYYYVPEETGLKYENELRELGCEAFSWRGFHHDESEVDPDEFIEQHRIYKNKLDGIEDFPFMPLTEEKYKTWFSDAETPVGPTHCENIEKLIDIQPNGDVNFCVDYPDYVFGNAKEKSIKELWNSDEANRFREYIRNRPLSVCYRCGAKFMSQDFD